MKEDKAEGALKTCSDLNKKCHEQESEEREKVRETNPQPFPHLTDNDIRHGFETLLGKVPRASSVGIQQLGLRGYFSETVEDMNAHDLFCQAESKGQGQPKVQEEDKRQQVLKRSRVSKKRRLQDILGPLQRESALKNCEKKRGATDSGPSKKCKIEDGATVSRAVRALADLLIRWESVSVEDAGRAFEALNGWEPNLEALRWRHMDVKAWYMGKFRDMLSRGQRFMRARSTRGAQYRYFWESWAEEGVEEPGCDKVELETAANAKLDAERVLPKAAEGQKRKYEERLAKRSKHKQCDKELGGFSLTSADELLDKARWGYQSNIYEELRTKSSEEETCACKTEQDTVLLQAAAEEGTRREVQTTSAGHADKDVGSRDADRSSPAREELANRAAEEGPQRQELQKTFSNFVSLLDPIEAAECARALLSSWTLDALDEARGLLSMANGWLPDDDEETPFDWYRTALERLVAQGKDGRESRNSTEEAAEKKGDRKQTGPTSFDMTKEPAIGEEKGLSGQEEEQEQKGREGTNVFEKEETTRAESASAESKRQKLSAKGSMDSGEPLNAAEGLSTTSLVGLTNPVRFPRAHSYDQDNKEARTFLERSEPEIHGAPDADLVSSEKPGGSESLSDVKLKHTPLEDIPLAQLLPKLAARTHRPCGSRLLLKQVCALVNAPTAQKAEAVRQVLREQSALCTSALNAPEALKLLEVLEHVAASRLARHTYLGCWQVGKCGARMPPKWYEKVVAQLRRLEWGERFLAEATIQGAGDGKLVPPRKARLFSVIGGLVNGVLKVLEQNSNGQLENQAELPASPPAAADVDASGNQRFIQVNPLYEAAALQSAERFRESNSHFINPLYEAVALHWAKTSKETGNQQRKCGQSNQEPLLSSPAGAFEKILPEYESDETNEATREKFEEEEALRNIEAACFGQTLRKTSTKRKATDQNPFTIPQDQARSSPEIVRRQVQVKQGAVEHLANPLEIQCPEGPRTPLKSELLVQAPRSPKLRIPGPSLVKEVCTSSQTRAGLDPEVNVQISGETKNREDLPIRALDLPEAARFFKVTSPGIAATESEGVIRHVRSKQGAFLRDVCALANASLEEKAAAIRSFFGSDSQEKVAVLDAVVRAAAPCLERDATTGHVTVLSARMNMPAGWADEALGLMGWKAPDGAAAKFEAGIEVGSAEPYGAVRRRSNRAKEYAADRIKTLVQNVVRALASLYQVQRASLQTPKSVAGVPGLDGKAAEPLMDLDGTEPLNQDRLRLFPDGSRGESKVKGEPACI